MRASPAHPAPGDAAVPGFDPVPLRYRSDGWTPQRQVDFVEALADCGIIRHAAAQVGMTEQSVSRLRRRPEARAFDLACDAAQRIGARNLVSVAWERAIHGTVRQLRYHGQVTGEERVFDNKLLMFLIGKLGPVLEPSRLSLDVERNWAAWMEAIRTETPSPPQQRAATERAEIEASIDEDKVWHDDDGEWWTSFPPPPGFQGYEENEDGAAYADGTDQRGGYRRTLTDRELAAVEAYVAANEADRAARDAARRDRWFGFTPERVSSSREAEPFEPSAMPACELPHLSAKGGGLVRG